MKAWSSEKISVFALVLLITGAIDSVRNLPVAALLGPSLIFFFIFFAIVFLIPVALVSAELASTWHEEEGGIYSWVHHAFGENWAFFTIWLQWINTVVWYPTILSFIAGTFAYLIDPELAQNKYYLITVVLTCFWGLTFLSLFGIRTSAAFASFCAILGVFLPMGLIILIAILWIVQGHPMAIDFNLASLIPHLHTTQSWVALIPIVTSFLGMELAAVHVRNVHNPQQNFPKAIYFSVILILTTMILGSLSIAFVLPQEKISLVRGVMQTFDNFFEVYHITPLMPIMVFLLLLGSLGSMVNWIISPAKGLLMAANHGFLSAWFFRQNQYGVASRILLSQAILVTFLCIGFLFFSSVNTIYWLFTALSTELYIVMYIIMFIAGIKLKHKFAQLPRPFAIPGGKAGFYGTCFLGLIGSVMTLMMGFIPPEDLIDIGNTTHYRFIFTLGLMGMLAPALWLCFRKHKKNRVKPSDSTVCL